MTVKAKKVHPRKNRGPEVFKRSGCRFLRGERNIPIEETAVCESGLALVNAVGLSFVVKF